MNDVHGIDVHLCQPFHHPLDLSDDVIELEVVALNRINFGANLFAADLVAAAINGVKQALCEIGARAEELHLFPDKHWRHAARDRAIVSPRSAHERVAFKLERARVDGDLRSKLPEAVRKPR